MRNESSLLTTLKERYRLESQPGESLLEEAVLETDIRLKSSSGDIGFTTLASIPLIKREITDHSHRIGQEMLDLGGEKFESLPQTVFWVRREPVFNSYYLFLDAISMLAFIEASNLSDNDFVDNQYRVARANFVNDRATRLSASFGRELPTLFCRAKPSATGEQPASTYFLPLINLYASFNSVDNKTEVKQRNLKEFNNVISSLSSDIVSNLSGSIVSKTVSFNYLSQSCSIIESLNNWMESFLPGASMYRTIISKGCVISCLFLCEGLSRGAKEGNRSSLRSL